MQEVESNLAIAKEKVAQILNAEVKEHDGKFIVIKKRIIEISVEKHCFTCLLDHDITFENISEDGAAFNKAEIFLLPEEFPAFFLALSDHSLPFPPYYRQYRRVNPHIISICLESWEPFENFAERLSAALKSIEHESCPLKNK